MLKRCAWFVAALPLAVASLAAAENNTFRPQPNDWPQWQGPERTAVSRETGLLPDWPKAGPPLAWKVKGLGQSFSTPSIAAGRIFTMSNRDNATKEKRECVLALNERDGKELWTAELGPAGKADPPGPRCTPTVDGDHVYALGVDGDLVCLETATGKEVWRKNLAKDFDGKVGGWRYSESPLIDGDKLICTPGGKKAALVALNKADGSVIWKCEAPGGGIQAAYSSVIAADIDGQRQYIQLMSGTVVGVNAADGKFLWRTKHPLADISCSTPVYHDHLVFAATDYGKGGGLTKITRDGDQVKAEDLYFTPNMKNHHGGMILVDGYLYGSDEGLLTCLEFKTGKVMWQDREPGKGSIALADGRFYYRNEGGPIHLVEVNPKKYVSHGKFDQPERSGQSAWPHPVIANGKLYIRDQDVLFCYDVKQK